MASSEKVSTDKCASKDHRKYQCDHKTGNAIICRTTTDNIEVTNGESGLVDHGKLGELENKFPQTIATTTDNQKWDRWPFWAPMLPFQVVLWCRNQLATNFYRARYGRKSRICRWNFYAVRHISRDISISGFSVICSQMAVCTILVSFLK